MFADKELAFVLNFGMSNDPQYPSVVEMLNKWEERHPNSDQSIESFTVNKKIDTEAFLWVLNRASVKTISQYNWTSLIDGWDKHVSKDSTTLNKILTTLNILLDECIVSKQHNSTASANQFGAIVRHIIAKVQHQNVYKSMTDENKENVFQLITKAFQSGLMKGRDFKEFSGPMLESFGLFNATNPTGVDHSLVVKGIAFNRGTSKIAFSENNILLNVLNKIALTSPDAVFDIKWQPDDIVGLGPAVVKLVQTIDQSQLSEAQKKSLWPCLEEDKRSQKEFSFDLVRSVCSIPYNQYSYMEQEALIANKWLCKKMFKIIQTSDVNVIKKVLDFVQKSTSFQKVLLETHPQMELVDLSSCASKWHYMSPNRKEVLNNLFSLFSTEAQNTFKLIKGEPWAGDLLPMSNPKPKMVPSTNIDAEIMVQYEKQKLLKELEISNIEQGHSQPKRKM